ncbi:MAG: cob(I)yrinic acid a,c-diamide adenosyltransferase [Desulfobacterales bacterium S5133MH4]|nr:MAG: cob(I)yrinic acid a,c-diamide adenosyltransferase [Desulfobacterales bacterium S5133MH4]
MQKEARYIHVYTGDGKGKTTAALGLTLRAVGAGWKVLFAQFLKHGEYNEIKALKKLGEQVTIRQYGSGRFIRGEPSREEIEMARVGLSEIMQVMEEGRYDLIVLDEINVAVHFVLIPLKSVMSLLERRPQDVELILTGRWAPKEIMERADLVTEVRMIKHYFSKGVQAREGIEK